MLKKIYKNKIKIIAIIAGVFVLLVAGYFYEKNQNQNFKQENNFTKKIEVNLTAEQLVDFENRVSEILDKIKNENPDENNDFYDDYLSLGIYYETLGDLEQAKNSLLKAGEIRPLSSLPWSNLGSLYQTMQDYSSAEHSLRKAIELEKEKASAYLKLTELYRYKLNADQETILQVYEMGIHNATDKYNLLVTSAKYLEDIGQIEKAIEVLETVKEMYPESEEIKRFLKDLGM